LAKISIYFAVKKGDQINALHKNPEMLMRFE